VVEAAEQLRLLEQVEQAAVEQAAAIPPLTTAIAL